MSAPGSRPSRYLSMVATPVLGSGFPCCSLSKISEAGVHPMAPSLCNHGQRGDARPCLVPTHIPNVYAVYCPRCRCVLGLRQRTVCIRCVPKPAICPSLRVPDDFCTDTTDSIWLRSARADFTPPQDLLRPEFEAPSSSAAQSSPVSDSTQGKVTGKKGWFRSAVEAVASIAAVLMAADDPGFAQLMLHGFR